MTIDNSKELAIIHAALIYFIETEDYTDEESVIITQLLQRCEENNGKVYP
jgi:hypothetical protein